MMHKRCTPQYACESTCCIGTEHLLYNIYLSMTELKTKKKLLEQRLYQVWEEPCHKHPPRRRSLLGWCSGTHLLRCGLFHLYQQPVGRKITLIIDLLTIYLKSRQLKHQWLMLLQSLRALDGNPGVTENYVIMFNVTMCKESDRWPSSKVEEEKVIF